jgi:hypothetical protein
VCSFAMQAFYDFLQNKTGLTPVAVCHRSQVAGAQEIQNWQAQLTSSRAVVARLEQQLEQAIIELDSVGSRHGADKLAVYKRNLVDLVLGLSAMTRPVLKAELEASGWPPGLVTSANKAQLMSTLAERKICAVIASRRASMAQPVVNDVTAFDDDDLETECAICSEPVVDPVPRAPNQLSITTLGCSHKYRECEATVLFAHSEFTIVVLMNACRADFKCIRTWYSGGHTTCPLCRRETVVLPQ